MDTEVRSLGLDRRLRVLVACEFSGRVRSGYRVLGHDAWSCDLEAAEDGSPYHIQADAVDTAYGQEWDVMVAHPPCTYLAISQQEQQDALAFVLNLANAPIPHIAIENPLSVLSTMWRKPDQIVEPWWFGDGERKRTCWWLKNLPLLTPTNIVEGRATRVQMMGESKNRARERSRTYEGMARAIALQWGGDVWR